MNRKNGWSKMDDELLRQLFLKYKGYTDINNKILQHFPDRTWASIRQRRINLRIVYRENKSNNKPIIYFKGDWIEMPSLPGYFISNDGKVRTDYRMISLCEDKDGYLIFNVKIAGKSSTRRIHRAVAECYIENRNNKPCINHKDLNKKNNHFMNLEWVTYSENIHHAMVNGIKFGPKK